MKEQQKDLLKQQLIYNTLAVESPLGLALLDDPTYETPKHLQLLNKKLLDVSNGKINRLMVFMPPRHGKSELCSKYFPAWYLGTHPDDRILLNSYEADFAATWGQKVRDIFKEHREIYGVMVNDRSAARNRWDIAGYRGGMGTAGVGGPITGKGAEIAIIDDPVKNSEQAHSPTYRDKAKEWYKSTLYTRLTPTGKIILIQTRWHEDDLGGWLLDESDDKWEVVSFPAIATDDNDVLGRKPGDALWPEFWTVPLLKQRENELGEYWFSAMYQQTPQPPEGGMLKRDWLTYYDTTNTYLDNVITYTGWDLAISEKESADYMASCTIKFNRLDGKMYVVDWTRDHLTFDEQVAKVREVHNRFNTDLIGIETNAYQLALAQALAKYMLPVQKIVSTKDKVIKITSTFMQFSQGNVFIPKNHHLLKEFENEYVYFPTGKHDDMLDATQMAIQMAIDGFNPYTNTDKNYEFSKRRLEQGNIRPKKMYQY